MFNDINIGPLTLHMYGLMIAVGFLAALFLSEYWTKKKGLDRDILYGILVCAIVYGLSVGAIALGYPAQEADQPAVRKQNDIVRM